MKAQLQTLNGVNISPITDVENINGLDNNKVMELISGIPTVVEETFTNNSPLEELIAKAKVVEVSSPEVNHNYYTNDIPVFSSPIKIWANESGEAELTFEQDTSMIKKGDTLLATSADDDSRPGYPLIMQVTENEETLKAVCLNFKVRDIAMDSAFILLSNAIEENSNDIDFGNAYTHKTKSVYLQKRGMTQEMYNYLLNPTGNVVMECAINNFNKRNKATILISTKSKANIGDETIYTSEGIKWQFGRIIKDVQDWTPKVITALAKLFFSNNPNLNTAILVGGKNLIEKLQNINYSDTGTTAIVRTNPAGNKVTVLNTVFGTIYIKYEAALDYCQEKNSGFLVGEDAFTRYVYSSKNEDNVIYDAIVLEGNGLWINGENAGYDSGPEYFMMWDKETAPTGITNHEMLYYLLCDCPGISREAMAGQVWRQKLNMQTESFHWVKVE